jgi:spore maturation protein SpmA
MTDPSAFVIRNMLDSAIAHLLVAPVAAVIVGIASGMVCALLRSARRETAIGLGLLNVGVFDVGVTSLQWASSIERSARPPFVMLAYARSASR